MKAEEKHLSFQNEAGTTLVGILTDTGSKVIALLHYHLTLA